MRGESRHRERRSDAADEIEEEESQMTHRLLYRGAEDEQVKHVASEMQDATVKEHRGHDGFQRGRCAETVGEARQLAPPFQRGGKTRGDHRILVDETPDVVAE